MERIHLGRRRWWMRYRLSTLQVARNYRSGGFQTRLWRVGVSGMAARVGRKSQRLHAGALRQTLAEGAIRALFRLADTSVSTGLTQGRGGMGLARFAAHLGPTPHPPYNSPPHGGEGHSVLCFSCLRPWAGSGNPWPAGRPWRCPGLVPGRITGRPRSAWCPGSNRVVPAVVPRSRPRAG